MYKAFLLSLTIIPLLMLTFSFLSINNLESEIKQLKRDNMKLENRIEKKDDQIAVLRNKYYNKKKEIKEINEKMDLLITFRDAGIMDHSVSDIRKMLDVANKVPYGSPFKSGHYLTSYYGKRDELNFGGSPDGHHAGVDIRPNKPNDTIIRATASGEVVDFGVSETLGKFIVFQTNGGYRLKYGHLDTIFWQDVEKRIVKGVKVKKGERLGIMGSTGSWSTGPHLHLEIHYQDKQDEYIELNPRRILEYIGGSVKQDNVTKEEDRDEPI